MKANKRRETITDFKGNKEKKGVGGRFLFLGSVLFITIIVGGGIFMLLYHSISKSVFFQVDQVDITGCQRLNTREVLSWSGLDIKTNLWSLRTAKLKKHLEENSWIESAVVKRKWPNGLQIRIHFV